jgi:hypothetical protein|tara:strand:+ start:532 stop:696 length:165 start_codon:yes stop_codon:yes gene_type:complete
MDGTMCVEALRTFYFPQTPAAQKYSLSKEKQFLIISNLFFAMLLLLLLLLLLFF